MLDLVFAVRDPVEWHNENIRKNYAHYSFLRWLGPAVVSRVQSAPAGVYYNTLVTVDKQVHQQQLTIYNIIVYVHLYALTTQLLKYGVISTADLVTDLLRWRWLYLVVDYTSQCSCCPQLRRLRVHCTATAVLQWCVPAFS